MATLNQTLVFLHFLGLVLGFSVGFANLTMSGLISNAEPSERAVLSRFPPRMSRLGTIGLALLWITGVILVYTSWNGFESLPWQFYVKLAAVVILTVTVHHTHRLERLVMQGDLKAAARIEQTGKVAMVMALTALLFAVLTFH